jgi:hypothetical protein
MWYTLKDFHMTTKSYEDEFGNDYNLLVLKALASTHFVT